MDAFPLVADSTRRSHLTHPRPPPYLAIRALLAQRLIDLNAPLARPTGPGGIDCFWPQPQRRPAPRPTPFQCCSFSPGTILLLEP